MEREIEAAGAGPARVRELVGGGVAVLDAGGRVHVVIGWTVDRGPVAATTDAISEAA